MKYISDPCAFIPCKNNGTCNRFGNGKYFCDCSMTGYNGLTCEEGKVMS